MQSWPTACSVFVLWIGCKEDQGSNENDNDTSKCSLTNTPIVVDTNPLKEGG